MKRISVYLFTGFCLFILNSCAGVGALVGVAAFGVTAYEGARTHYPELKLKPIDSHLNLSNLQFFSNQTTPQKNFEGKKANSKIFGFDCSRQENEIDQSKCFSDFSKALSKDEKSKDNQNLAFKNEKKEKIIKKQVSGVLTKKKPLTKINIARSSNQNITPSYIEKWANAWQEKNISSYLSFYSKDFKGLKNHRQDWEASRQRALIKNKNISIKLSNIKVDQKSKNLIEVNFIQNYKSDGYSDTGIKELILLKKDGDWKIVKESWMPINKITQNNGSSAGKIKNITNKLTKWLKAWENQDVYTYLSFYSEKFQTPKNNQKEWKISRYSNLQSRKIHSIKISNLQITQNKDRIEVNFIQKFNSDKYSDIGIKELVWVRTEGSWKILKETWISI
jgi:ketosteroid isomerase-like protein